MANIIWGLKGESSFLNKKSSQSVPDHGIMGALLLLDENKFPLNNILPCASAIALHYKLKFAEGMDIIDFDSHPLAYLLIYCDLLHEWARETSTGDWFKGRYPELQELNLKTEPLSADKKGERKAIVSKIKIDDQDTVRTKIKEAQDTFRKLKPGKKVNFYIKINEKLVPE